MTSKAVPRTYKGVCIDAAGGQTMADLFQFIVAKYLEPYGHKFELTWTGEGQEGLDLIISVRPDLVFLDFTVLGIGGFEVYQRMKADEYMRTIPIIVITARHDVYEQYIVGNLMVVEAFFTKPFVPKDFGPAVIKILGLADQAST